MTNLEKIQFNSDLTIQAKDESKIYYIDVYQSGNLTIDLRKGKYDIIINFENKEDIVFRNTIQTSEGAEVTTTFIGLAKASLDQQTNFNIGVDSSLKLISSYYVENDKKVILNCYNTDKRSHVEMDNSCVVSSKGNLSMDVVGKILHGASGSSSHQTTRCLTVGDVKNAKVNPLLLIDENDVEASHAMALGTIDQEHLFYMQTRGLTYQECIRLLFESYLMPDLEHIADKDLKETIYEEIRKKVKF